MLFVPSIDWATTIKLGGAESLKHDPPKPFIGSSNGFGDQDPKDQRFGHITAFDAASGKVLLKKALGDPIGGGVVTYMLDGTQYVAVAGGMKNPIVQTESGPAWGWPSSRCPIGRSRKQRAGTATARTGRFCRNFYLRHFEV
jgi:hypothetical protein